MCKLQGVGKPALTVSGLAMHLHQQPLGVPLMVNSVAVDRSGTIGLFHTKLTVALKDAGVHIPLALTISNRTELIKEREIRGNIGVTFDVDKLVAR